MQSKRMMMLLLAAELAFGPRIFAADAASKSKSEPHRSKIIQIEEETVPWADAPASIPAGVKIAVLEGDPAKEGLFTLRLKVPEGTRIMPHWHPKDERVTVLSGTVRVGFGDVFEIEKTEAFESGGYYVNPAKVHHFNYFEEDSIIQVTGIGPWGIHYVASGAGSK